MRRLWIYISIYVLTAADLIFTCIGLEQGVIKEANPMMEFFLSQWPLFTVIVVLLVTALALYFIYKVGKQIKWLVQALGLLMTLKIVVLLMHSYWIIRVLKIFH